MKSRFKKWLPAVVVVLIFGGARAIHSGGVFGILRDAGVSQTAGSEFDSIRDAMVSALAPVGAAAMCAKERGKTPRLAAAVEAYNRRNAREMKAIVSRAEQAEVTRAQKNLIDRSAVQAARRLLGTDVEQACEKLPARLNAHEFDL